MNNDEQLTRSVHFKAAYDRRSPDPVKNYGVHGVEIWFVLKGAQGAVVFTLYTGWMLPHVQAEWDQLGKAGLSRPLPADVSYHSYVPVYADQTPTAECALLEGKPCYCDGSALYAKDVFELLVTGGEDVMWEELTKWYNRQLRQLVPAGDAI